MKGIFIPGGGLLNNGTPCPWVIARLDKSIELYTGNELVVLLSRGTTHKPPILDKNGFPITEAHASAQYLVKHGINPHHLRLEELSLDTIGNVYFSRLLFTDVEHIDEIVFVQSDFAMPRLQFLVKWIYGLKPQNESIRLAFVRTPNNGLSNEAREAREAKEQASLNSFKQSTRGITTLNAFSKWLFTSNPKYAYGDTTYRPTDNSSLATY